MNNGQTPSGPSDKMRADNEIQAILSEADARAAKAKAQEPAPEPNQTAYPMEAPPIPPMEPPPKRPKGSRFVRFGFYLSIFLVCVCLSVIGYDYYKAYRDQKLYEELKNSQNQIQPGDEEPAAGGERAMLPHLVDAYEQNGQLVGWIKVDDTEVDFPVMQTGDNSYYLTANFNRQSSKYGTPFVDYRIDLSAQPYEHPDNLIIYGHNMGDGLMFYDFVRYQGTEFYTEHPTIKVSSLYDERTFKVFAAFISNGESRNGYIFPYHMYLDFASQSQFDAYIGEILDRSIINVDIEVGYGDALLCISTCTYEFDGARFVVFARELREGESPEANAVSRNLDPLYPAAFTRLYGGRSDS